MRLTGQPVRSGGAREGAGRKKGSKNRPPIHLDYKIDSKANLIRANKDLYDMVLSRMISSADASTLSRILLSQDKLLLTSEVEELLNILKEKRKILEEHLEQIEEEKNTNSDVSGQADENDNRSNMI